MTLTRRPAAIAMAALLVLAACGTDDETPTVDATSDSADAAAPESAPEATDAATDDPTADAPSVVASTTIWADVVSEVACGELAEVSTIIPPGGDPHSFEPSLRDREGLSNAALIVANGLGLEESLEDTIDAVESEGVPVVRVGDSIEALPADDDDDDDHDDDHDHDDHDSAEGDTSDDDHDHGPDDPHFWFDPTRVAATLPAIADALATAGLDRAALDACAADFADRLEQLDTDVEATVATLPIERRLLVTNHDSLSYFADRYDFEVLGSVIPSPSSLAATNPGDLEELADLIEQTGVPAIFAETQHSSSDTEALADRVGDVEVVTLQTDTLGEPGGDSGNYVDWLTVLAATIVGSLARG